MSGREEEMSGELVQFESNGGSTTAYLAVSSTGKGPGIIVLQEWWGLVPHIKNICDRLSEEGFSALAPDLYHGESTTSPDDAGRMMMVLQIDRAAKDLEAAVQYLSSHASVSGDRVGCVGFCMGGQLALFAASKNSAIGACVDYYGIHPSVRPNFSESQAPVLGFFGEKDDSVTPDDALALEQLLKKAGVQTDFTVFPGVGHAFFNDTRPEVYDEVSAKKSWEKMLLFFRENLN